MRVPVFELFVALIALDFANEVALDVADGVLADDAVLTPFVQVLAIEAGMESLCEQVHVDVVVLKQVKHVHLADGRHLNRSFAKFASFINNFIKEFITTLRLLISSSSSCSIDVKVAAKRRWEPNSAKSPTQTQI